MVGFGHRNEGRINCLELDSFSVLGPVPKPLENMREESGVWKESRSANMALGLKSLFSSETECVTPPDWRQGVGVCTFVNSTPLSLLDTRLTNDFT